MQVPEKFVKLMMMTTSEHDGEALNAFRIANAMLAEANVNWEEFISLVKETNEEKIHRHHQPPHEEDPFEDVGVERDLHGRYIDEIAINSLFQQCFNNTRRTSSFWGFLQSVHDFWNAKGYLTQKQYEALRRCASR